MAKSRQQKHDTLAQLNDGMERSKGAVFANYVGLTVAEVQELRRELRQQGSEMVVAKKTLLKRMLEQADLGTEIIDTIEGGVAVVFGYEDEVAPAKVVATFAKDHETVELYGGVLEGAVINGEKAVALSKLPSKDELLAKMVGSLKSPISGLANVLGGNTRGLVQVLSQIKDQKAA